MSQENPVFEIVSQILKEQELKYSTPIITSDEIEKDYKNYEGSYSKCIWWSRKFTKRFG